MNPEIKQKWLEALRGGEYKQAQRSLRVGDGYCCLGVLCDIMDAEWEVYTSSLEGMRYQTDEHCTNYPPEWVTRDAGLSDRNPVVIVDGSPTTLASRNDQGATFLEIADLIEAQL